MSATFGFTMSCVLFFLQKYADHQACLNVLFRTHFSFVLIGLASGGITQKCSLSSCRKKNIRGGGAIHTF
jgi:hypothetical protein